MYTSSFTFQLCLKLHDFPSVVPLLMATRRVMTIAFWGDIFATVQWLHALFTTH
jgi:hypothetical protein